jgi:hypothetical protein
VKAQRQRACRGKHQEPFAALHGATLADRACIAHSIYKPSYAADIPERPEKMSDGWAASGSSRRERLEISVEADLGGQVQKA